MSLLAIDPCCAIDPLLCHLGYIRIMRIMACVSVHQASSSVAVKPSSQRLSRHARRTAYYDSCASSGPIVAPQPRSWMSGYSVRNTPCWTTISILHTPYCAMGTGWLGSPHVSVMLRPSPCCSPHASRSLSEPQDQSHSSSANPASHPSQTLITTEAEGMISATPPHSVRATDRTARLLPSRFSYPAPAVTHVPAPTCCRKSHRRTNHEHSIPLPEYSVCTTPSTNLSKGTQYEGLDTEQARYGVRVHMYSVLRNLQSPPQAVLIATGQDRPQLALLRSTQ